MSPPEGDVPAEYGRFTGGVVNVITKSGGNDYSGAFRLGTTYDDWKLRHHRAAWIVWWPPVGFDVVLPSWC